MAKDNWITHCYTIFRFGHEKKTGIILKPIHSSLRSESTISGSYQCCNCVLFCIPDICSKICLFIYIVLIKINILLMK